MKLLFDQNISHRILAYVNAEFPDSSSVKSEGLINAQDLKIWDFARKSEYAIVSQDADFFAIQTLHGYPPK